MSVDYNVLEKFLDIDELELNYHRVTNDINSIDIYYRCPPSNKTIHTDPWFAIYNTKPHARPCVCQHSYLGTRCLQQFGECRVRFWGRKLTPSNVKQN